MSGPALKVAEERFGDGQEISKSACIVLSRFEKRSALASNRQLSWVQETLVLGNRHRDGLPYHLIGRNVGLSRNPVMEIVRRGATAYGVGW